jgi:serine/threonine protein kinase/tetratricopeptide (TPR) repeat protein
MAADRHLLFGLLALQTGLIQQAQLVAAFHAWTCDKSRSLADHLIALGHIDAARRAAVEALADVHVVAQNGDVEKSLAAIPAARSMRESLARLADADIAASLGRVAMASKHADDDDDRTASYPVGTATSNGQRFRVLRPHARGGLGSVFVALDTELNREVALKQILDHRADDPKSRQRFLVEAEITGGLEHPGIVPVYGLGTYAGGRPFYAMRLVKGDSLKEAIDAHHRLAQGNRPSPQRGEGAQLADEVGLRESRLLAESGLTKAGTPIEGTAGARPNSAQRAEGTRRSKIRRGGAGGGAASTIVTRDLELRKLLRRFLDVCNAIDYAHSRGVLHRDIKPRNIILGKYGETLVVDWGLAKATGRSDSASGERTLVPSSASGSADTIPGSALGTPAYMSPEQAAGDLDRLGPRSDVYSLGATLYCLLTGKPSQEGDDIGEVLRKVQRGEFPPPRQLDPSIDPALEAVCKKAMATKPDDRYGSVRALIEDVERWMADEPVSAWRQPLSRRVQRWARRNRSLVTAAAAAVLVALAGLGAVLAVQRGANRALAASNADLNQANTSLHEAIQQKDAANTALAEANGRVQARFDLARDAIRSFKQGVEEEEALKENRLRPLRDKLLGSARRFYDKLGDLLKGQTDVASKAVLAESFMELGELIDQIGQKPEALEAYKKVVAIRRELAAQPGAGAAERVKLSQALSDLGEEARETADHAGSLAAQEEARALAEPLAAGPGATIEARRALGSAHLGSGAVLQATGKVAEALAAFRRAREVGEALARDAADVADDREKLAVTYAWVGALLEQTGDLSGALAEQRRYQELCRALVAEHPEVPRYCHELAVSHNCVGRLLEKTGNLAGALADQRTYQELSQALAAEHPEVPGYRSDLAVSHSWVGGLLEKTGDLAGALAEQQMYEELFRALAAERPEVPDFRRELANSHSRVGNLLTMAGTPAEALAELERARALFESLAQASPNVPNYRDGLAFALNFAGDALRDLGRSAEARDRHARAVALAEALASASPTVAAYRARLADGLRRLARVKLDAGDTAGADVDSRRAVMLFEALPSRDGSQSFALACARATLAAAAGRGGSGPSAALAPELADRAMTDLQRAAAAGYRSPAVYRHEPALGPLRGRDDFQLLMMDLAMPAAPFAAAP